VDEVKALCRDFSSRTGNVYIKDVESALDGLAALPSADPTYPASERADAGKDAALTDEQKKAIAQDVHVTCSCIPGATFYNAAEMAIDAILAANKGSQNGR
jgi:phage tail protein X